MSNPSWIKAPSWMKATEGEDAGIGMLLLSCSPIVILGLVGLLNWRLSSLRTRNEKRKAQLLIDLGLEKADSGKAVAGKKAAKVEKKQRTFVGFWHPYCNAGGGGERVLWTAIAYLQATQPDVVCLVYTGDIPAATKEEIIAKVKNRFELTLAPSTLHFVPLPSRHLLNDDAWSRFSLVGQSLGSMWCLLQGIGAIGSTGLWGDCFIDTMGYAFTYPLFQLVAGSGVPIMAYIHYPTVSTDMVERVRGRLPGITNNNAVASSWLKTKLKLVYYSIFTKLYAFSLLFSTVTMTNSTWTQQHISSLLKVGRASFLGSFLTFEDTVIPESRFAPKRAPPPPPPVVKGKGKKAAEVATPGPWIGCEVVYPPCDTREFNKCGKLDRRERIIVSLSQFRPEKEHATQLRALHQLFQDHPEYVGKEDPSKMIKLVMMGSSRGTADEERVEGLRKLAVELGIQNNVEFIVNAPFPALVEWLGKSSVGLNAMVDEHFGINIVEFMAAGLIPLVHASAGPYLDIVVPREGQRTGFHATDYKTFAVAMHEIFNLSNSEQMKIRQAARRLAQEKFSQEEFELGLEKGWVKIKGLIEAERAKLNPVVEDKKRK